MSLEPGQTLLHYRLLGKIGAGGMGEVYAAEDTRLGREVALKVLPVETGASLERFTRFQREARALAALNHPHIVTLYAVEEAEGVHFITMERVRGRTLASLIPADGLPSATFFELAIPLVDAVAAAHEQGILHRDLKTTNVMVGDGGRLKVLDFGLAKLEPGHNPTGGSAPDTLTRQGHVVGTAAYMSPEQAKGETVDHRSDLFSLGIVLFEMATGHRPFKGRTPADLLASILRDPPAAIAEFRSDLPVPLEASIRRCLEKDPRGRYQSALDLRHDLAAAQGQTVAGGAADRGLSIAVLPFADLSPEKDQDYFCEGMAEEIISALMGLQGLRVVSRMSSFTIRASPSDAPTIGRKLGVSHLLEGSVRKAGDRLRVTVQLVEVAADSYLWSERYDGELGDVFAIQGKIAASVARELRMSLTGGKVAGTGVASPSLVQAYDYYLRGRQLFYRDNKRSLEFARQMFARAAEIDPSYTRAYAGIADSCSILYKHFQRDPLLLQEADRASHKAIDIDPASAEAHTSRAVVNWLQGRLADAEREFEAAIALNPRLFEAHYLYGHYGYNCGKPDTAALHYERASELRPEDYQSPLILGAVHRGLGRQAEACAAYRRGLAIAERHLELNPDDVRARYLGAGALVALGETAKGLDWARIALELAPEDPMTLMNLAGIHASAGRIEQAIDYTERAIDCGFGYKPNLEHDPDLDPLRGHPRFQRLLDRL